MSHKVNRIRYKVESALYAVKWWFAALLHRLAALLDDEVCQETFDLKYR